MFASSKPEVSDGEAGTSPAENRTEAALISRGIDSHTAKGLRRAGWTLAKLKVCSAEQLLMLGLTSEAQVKILSEDRPPIPPKNVTSVLFANRFLCCVCRDAEKSIVVHHIDPWASSRDHSLGNLAVLCLDHHDKAHTRSELSIILSPEKLKVSKANWEKEVKALDPIAIRKATRLDYDAWYYFNHLRLFELAAELGLEFRRLPHYRAALDSGLIEPNGTIRVEGTPAYMYSGGTGMVRYAYAREMMDDILPRLNITNISDHLDRGVLNSCLAAGDFIFFQGAHVFKQMGRNKDGSPQSCRGVREANGIRVTYSFDRWEATSNSAWAVWLRGRQVVGSLAQVKDVERSSDKLVITCTVLGISAKLDGVKLRDYAPRAPYPSNFFDSDGDDNPDFHNDL